MSAQVLDPSLYETEELIVFEEGLFGFEEQKQFLPLPLDDGAGDVICLLSVMDESVSFVIMNPFSLLETYDPKLSEEEYRKLDVQSEEEISFYVVCVVREEAEQSTVNLKCPIAVNVKTRKAVQVILQTNAYQFRHKLVDLKRGEV